MRFRLLVCAWQDDILSVRWFIRDWKWFFLISRISLCKRYRSCGSRLHSENNVTGFYTRKFMFDKTLAPICNIRDIYLPDIEHSNCVLFINHIYAQSSALIRDLNAWSKLVMFHTWHQWIVLRWNVWTSFVELTARVHVSGFELYPFHITIKHTIKPVTLLVYEIYVF